MREERKEMVFDLEKRKDKRGNRLRKMDWKREERKKERG